MHFCTQKVQNFLNLCLLIQNVRIAHFPNKINFLWYLTLLLKKGARYVSSNKACLKGMLSFIFQYYVREYYLIVLLRNIPSVNWGMFPHTMWECSTLVDKKHSQR